MCFLWLLLPYLLKVYTKCVTLALWNYIVIPNQVIFEYFMLSGFNVLDVTLKCLEFSCTMFMCSNGEKVMSFCKVYIHKMAFLLNNPLNFTPSHLQKEKKWLNIQNRHSWFENSKELRKWYTFSVYFSALYWPLQFCNQCH